MSESESPEIHRLTADMLDEVVRIHLHGMGYTLNALLGSDHLKFLYGVMAADPECFAGVALAGGRPAGVVSGTIDAARFSERMMRVMPVTRLLRTGSRMLLRPDMIRLWFQGNSIARPVRTDAGQVRAVLTAIVVDTGMRRRGIGHSLVAAFERFLRKADVRTYRLDTQVANERAILFYQDLGFAEVARRADSIILVRDLSA